MSVSTLLGFAPASFILAVVPGPSVLFGLLAGTARTWFATDAGRLRRCQRGGGLLMAGLGGGLLVETARA